MLTKKASIKRTSAFENADEKNMYYKNIAFDDVDEKNVYYKKHCI